MYILLYIYLLYILLFIYYIYIIIYIYKYILFYIYIYNVKLLTPIAVFIAIWLVDLSTILTALVI